MMIGSFTAGDVLGLTSYALVNGTLRDVLAWSVDRDIDSDLPAGVAGGTGVTQATGSITWASASDVTDGALNPWNPATGWIPREGDTVEIWVGDGVSTWIQFNGLIDSSSGDIGGGMSSKIIDRIDDLSALAGLPSLADVMPPEVASGNWRRYGLTPRWAIAHVLRKAGFYATPAKEAHTTVDVPAFGGMWPTIGDMTKCSRGTDLDVSPLWPNGTHVADVNSAYAPTDPRRGNVAVQMTMNIHTSHAGVASLQAFYGSDNIILRATASNVLFIVNGTTVCTVPRSGSVIAQVLFDGSTARLRTSAGQDVTNTVSWSTSAYMTEARIIADPESRVNGFIISHPEESWHEFANINWAPSANIVSGAMHGAMAGLHATRDQNVREILDDIASSLLWPHWIDESGVMQVIASDVLRDRPSVTAMTTLDDIRELSWQRDLLGLRKEILTQFERITVNRRKDYSLPVFESSESVVLKSDEEHVTFVDPGSDEWLMVDTSPGGVDDTANINSGIGTWVGGIYTDGVTEEWTNLTGTQMIVTMSAVGDGTWKIVHTAQTLDAGKQVELRSVRSDFMGTTVLWPYWWEKNLPIVRAKGSFTTTNVDRPSVSAATQGPVLQHSCGLWATGNTETTETTVVDAITTFLAEQTTEPHPTITNLRTTFDPRLQLGDVITVSSTTLMGVELTCLIIGKNINSDGASYSMTLAVRVLSIKQSFTTYAEWEEAWGTTANYTALEAAWGATATYTDFNNDPKNGAA